LYNFAFGLFILL